MDRLYEYKPAGHRWRYDIVGKRSWCPECGLIVSEAEYLQRPLSTKAIFRSDCPNPERKAFHDLMYGERATITMKNGSTITGQGGEGRIKGRSGDILWWNDEFSVEDEHGNHRWEAIVPRSLLANTEFDQSER